MMIDMVAGYARGYNEREIRPFLKSLRGSGYSGRILMFVNGGAAKEAKLWDVDVRPCPFPLIKVHSDRFVKLEKALADVRCEGIFLADTRDVIFQKDPGAFLPFEGLHVFEEDDSMTIGTCPYNSEWVRIGYGQEGIKALGHFPISCVGTTCGDRDSVVNYLKHQRVQVEHLQPKTTKPQDQATHNFLVRKCLGATVWNNEEGEIYTVGYVQRGTVKIVDGKMVNKSGRVPTVIHQWDRHKNLTGLVEEIYL